ncbi:macrophage mannose receptor 1-like protein [Aphelenchoides avenae]|nr:macrophage mannose receptor 1-like protein [Aphelenchus avenae]
MQRGGVGDFDCYQLTTVTAEYSQALADCIAVNGALPTLPNALTKSLLAAKAPDGGIWLLDSILNKNLVTGVWTVRWSDYSVSDLNRWAKSLTSVDEERRFALMPNEELKTINFDSNVTKRYICKVAPVFDFPGVAKESKPSDLECRKGWTHLKSSDTCVKLDNNTVTWLEGLQRCRKLGGDLVHVKSAAIEKELTGLFTDDVDRLTRFYAIGLYRPDSSDVWTYTDGTVIGGYSAFSFAPPSTWGRCAFISTVTQVINVQAMTVRQKK